MPFPRIFLLRLHQGFVLGLSISLVLSPTVQAMPSVHRVMAQEGLQRVSFQPSRKHRVSLDKDLWSLPEDKHVVLNDGVDSLVALYKKTLDQKSYLVFQALKNDHYCFSPDVSSDSNSPNYFSSGSLLILNPNGTVTLTGEGLLKGTLRLSAGKFLNAGKVSIQGQAIFNIRQGLNEEGALLKARQDILISGRRDNRPFAKFVNEGKVASKTTLYYQGKELHQGAQGVSFAGRYLSWHGKHLEGKGTFVSPIMDWDIHRSMNFDEAVLQAICIHIVTKGYIDIKNRSQFKARNSLIVNAQDLKGSAHFEVSKSVSLPFHLFYEDARPKGSRAKQLYKAAAEYYKTNFPHTTPGCHFTVGKSFHLDDSSTWDVTAGPAHVQTSFAHIKAQLNGGPYNQQGFSINAKQMSYAGTLKSLRASFSSQAASLDGKFDVGHFILMGDTFTLPGTFAGKDLSTKTQSMNISGSVDYTQMLLANDKTRLQGDAKAASLIAQGASFHLGSRGTLNASNAQFNSRHLNMAGNASINHAHVTAQNVNVAKGGHISLGHVNNLCPSWTSAGSTQIGSFHSQTSNLSLSGNMAIGQAQVTCNSAHLSDVHIGHMNLQGGNLSTSNTSGGTWNLNLSHDLSSHNVNVSALNLAASSWRHTGLLSSHAHVNVGSANLSGQIHGSLQGRIGNFHNTGDIQANVDLMGNHFENQGSITAPHLIRLDYDRYSSLGGIKTQALDLTLNDRWVNAALLNDLEQTKQFQSLAVHTNQNLDFTESFQFGKSLSLSAPSINFESHPQNLPRLKGFFGFLYPTLQTYPRLRFNVAGNLNLDSRNTPIKVKYFDISSHNLSVGSPGLTLTASSLKAHDLLSFRVQGDANLSIHGTTPSLLHGRNVLGDVDGKFINTASHVLADRNIGIKATKGFVTHARETLHSSKKTKKTWGGLVKKTTTHTWSEIDRPSFNAPSVHLLSEKGGANLDSTDFYSGETLLEVAGSVTNKERLGFNETVVKKNIVGLSRSSKRNYQEFSSPTLIRAVEGPIKVRSYNEGIDLPNTVFLTTSHLDLEAQKDIRLSPMTLERQQVFKSNGYTVDNILLNPYIPDSLANSVSKVSQSEGIDQISASIRAMVNLRNTMKDFSSAATAKEFMNGRLAQSLESLCNVTIGYQETNMESSQTFQGQGSILARSAKIHSHQGDIRFEKGLPVTVNNRLEIKAPKGTFKRSGFEAREDFSYRKASIDVTVSPFEGITGVSGSAVDNSKESNSWTPQVIEAGELLINAKAIHEQAPVPLYSRESNSSVGFSVQKNGSFSVECNGYGFGYSPSNDQKDHWGMASLKIKGHDIAIPLTSGNANEQKDVGAPRSPSTEPSVYHYPQERVPSDKPEISLYDTFRTFYNPISWEDISIPGQELETQSTNSPAPQEQSQKHVPSDKPGISQFDAFEALHTPISWENMLIPVVETSASPKKRTLSHRDEDTQYMMEYHNMEDPDFYIKPFVEGTMSGAYETVSSYIELIKHPIDNGFMPLYTLDSDMRNMFWGALSQGLCYLTEQMNGKCISTFHKSAAYQESLTHMQAIETAALQYVLDVYHADGMTRSKRLGEAVGGLGTSGAILKSVKAIGKTAKVLKGPYIGARAKRNWDRYKKRKEHSKNPTDFPKDGSTIECEARKPKPRDTFFTLKEEIFWRMTDGTKQGGFLTRVRPHSRQYGQQAWSLHPNYNTAKYIQRVVVPMGVLLKRSRAKPLFGQVGGGVQLQIKAHRHRVDFGPLERLAPSKMSKSGELAAFNALSLSLPQDELSLDLVP